MSPGQDNPTPALTTCPLDISACWLERPFFLPHDKFAMAARASARKRKRTSSRAFAAVQTRPGVLIEGGYLNRPYAMETKHIDDFDDHNHMVQHTFVRINKGQDWLFKAVAGTDASRRDLSDLKLLDDIENAVRAMAATSDESQDQKAAPARPPAKRYKSRRARDLITRITMPLHPPNCDKPDDTVEVRVYQDGRTGKGQWIDVESIPWVVTYLRSERASAGCDAPDTAVADDAGDEPIQGVSITWNWQSNEWIASFSDALREKHTCLPPRDIRSSPKDLTPEKWAASAHRHGMTVDFDASDPSQRREATRCYLIEYINTELNK